MILKPQEGPQEHFLSSEADFVIYGGAAGGGKTFALLLEPLRHIHVAGFGATIFRQSNPQIKNQGGLWDESEKIYSHLGASPKSIELEWVFPSGARVVFEHLGETDYQQNQTVKKFQGSQIPLICFDELTHFCRSAVFYLLSRNRSTCGVSPYIRATCNPDADSWVREFIDWWVDDNGFIRQDRSGVIRYFIVLNDEVIWGDSIEELKEKYGDEIYPLSFTFISASLTDNKILMDIDKGYLAKLKALPLVERERLLQGNWNIKYNAGSVFKSEWFDIVNAAPAGGKVVRRWDLAATKDGGDWTVGLKLRKENGFYYVEDVVRFQGSSSEVERAIINTAKQDRYNCTVGLPQDPGQAGKMQAQYLTRQLSGFTVRSLRETGDKLTRALPVSSQAEAGNIKLVKGQWNESFLRELNNFSGEKDGTDDQVDALSGAFTLLETNNILVY